MKKIILVSFFLALLLMSFTYGNDIKETTDIPNVEVKENNNPMQNLYFKFCPDGLTGNLTNSIDMAVEQGSKESICYLFENKGNTNIKLLLELTDLSLNSNDNEFCNHKSKDFVNFAESWTEFEEIEVPANNYITRTLDVNFPLGLSGELRGCLGYAQKQEDAAGMLKTRVLYGKKMNFFIGNIKDIDNNIKLEESSINKNENGEVILSMVLKNVGNIENKISMVGSISNIIGFKKTFNITGDTNLTPGSTMPLEMNLGQLPTYGGLYSIKLDIGLQPFFKYKISSSSIDPKTLENKTITTKLSYFETPRMVIGIIILIIFILILAFRKPKQKVIYVEKPTTK